MSLQPCRLRLPRTFDGVAPTRMRLRSDAVRWLRGPAAVRGRISCGVRSQACVRGVADEVREHRGVGREFAPATRRSDSGSVSFARRHGAPTQRLSIDARAFPRHRAPQRERACLVRLLPLHARFEPQLLRRQLRAQARHLRDPAAPPPRGTARQLVGERAGAYFLGDPERAPRRIAASLRAPRSRRRSAPRTANTAPTRKRARHSGFADFTRMRRTIEIASSAAAARTRDVAGGEQRLRQRGVRVDAVEVETERRVLRVGRAQIRDGPGQVASGRCAACARSLENALRAREHLSRRARGRAPCPRRADRRACAARPRSARGCARRRADPRRSAPTGAGTRARGRSWSTDAALPATRSVLAGPSFVPDAFLDGDGRAQRLE